MPPISPGGERSPEDAGIRLPWARSDRPVPRLVVRPIQEFLQTATAGASLLLIAAVIALIWANAPFGSSYQRLWLTKLSIGIGDRTIEESLRYWINDGLMALFFLVVGLEIKREFLIGELRDRRAAAAPVVASIGGMVLPVLIYLAVNAGGDGTRGWGVVMPTDIAFTLGLLALATAGAAPGLKPFVLTLALVDDIATIVVIGIFYPTEIAVMPLVVAAAVAGAIVLLQRIHVRMMAVYITLGVGMWLALHASGIPPVLAGVVAGLVTPALPFQRPRDVSEEAIRTADQTVDEPSPPDADAFWWLRLAWLSKEAVSPLARAEHALLPWTSFVIVPLFALANAGVRVVGSDLSGALHGPVAIGIVLARVIGKPLGIAFGTWLAVRTGIGRLPSDTKPAGVIGVGLAAGIAFTVSLFVSELSFAGQPLLLHAAKVGILITAATAGIVGFVVLRLTSGPRVRHWSVSD